MVLALFSFVLIVLNFWMSDVSYSFANKTLEIDSVPKGYKLNNKNLDYLYSYLAGLIEGDGHFNVPKVLKDSKGKSRAAGIEVIFALKDKPLAELLKTKFGGNLYLRPGKNLVRWIIQDIKSVSYVLNAINGKLRTPKIHGFYSMIDFLKLKGVNIEKLPLDTSPFNSNAWLTGFIDSDGHFAIKGFTENPKSHLSIQFYISQRRTDKSGDSLEKIMLQLAEFLCTKLNERVICWNILSFKIVDQKPLDLINIILLNERVICWKYSIFQNYGPKNH